MSGTIRVPYFLQRSHTLTKVDLTSSEIIYAHPSNSSIQSSWQSSSQICIFFKTLVRGLEIARMDRQGCRQNWSVAWATTYRFPVCQHELKNCNWIAIFWLWVDGCEITWACPSVARRRDVTLGVAKSHYHAEKSIADHRLRSRIVKEPSRPMIPIGTADLTMNYSSDNWDWRMWQRDSQQSEYAK